MAKLVLLLGGVRSGKSRRAQEIAEGYGKVTFIATAEASDEEMAERIECHRRQRPADWITLEADANAAALLEGHVKGSRHVFVLDCLTIYVAGLMEAGLDQEAVEKHMMGVLKTASRIPDGLVIVSNEVGWGVVPPYPQGRIYRDVLGRCNQLVAAEADEVFLMVAGLPIKIK